jgi:hypothetical protein
MHASWGDTPIRVQLIRNFEMGEVITCFELALSNFAN